MKLDQLVVKVADQNEIESKYLWYCPISPNPKNIYRINLSTQKVDFSMTLLHLTHIRHFQILPDNNIFGVNVNWSQYPFTSDDSFNIQPIKLSKHNDLFHIDSIDIASCFYDDSIFLFEHGDDFYRDLIEEGNSNFYWFKRYSLSQKRWASLATPSFYSLTSCIGFNQKILISDGSSGIWVYDIILDSYSQFCKNIFPAKSSKIFIKNCGKVYIINQSSPYWIYSCEGNLSDWTFVCESKNSLRMDYSLKFFYYTYYEGSIYHLSDSSLFKFDLKKLKITKVNNYRKLK